MCVSVAASRWRLLCHSSCSCHFLSSISPSYCSHLLIDIKKFRLCVCNDLFFLSVYTYSIYFSARSLPLLMALLPFFSCALLVPLIHIHFKFTMLLYSINFVRAEWFECFGSCASKWPLSHCRIVDGNIARGVRPPPFRSHRLIAAAAQHSLRSFERFVDLCGADILDILSRFATRKHRIQSRVEFFLFCLQI